MVETQACVRDEEESPLSPQGCHCGQPLPCWSRRLEHGARQMGPLGILQHGTQSSAGRSVVVKPWKKGKSTLNTQILRQTLPQTVSVPLSP